MVCIHSSAFFSLGKLIDAKRVPPNVEFEVDDVESEWPERPPFDFIHSRYMCGSISDWPKFLRQAYRYVLCLLGVTQSILVANKSG
jgi:hypothetical protein